MHKVCINIEEIIMHKVCINIEEIIMHKVCINIEEIGEIECRLAYLQIFLHFLQIFFFYPLI